MVEITPFHDHLALEVPLPSTITPSTPTALETDPEVTEQKVNASPSE